jgi:hypothetical protein
MKFGFILGFTLLFAVQGAELVRDGKAIAEIIIPADAVSVEKLAAQELASHIHMISGGKPAIVNSPGTADVQIRLGRASALNIAGLRQNGAKIRINSNRIDIAGVDGKGAALNRATPAGTLFGVYDFLEKKLGVRWLWPGDSGTSYQQTANITLPDEEWEVAPPLAFANWRQNNRPAAWNKKENAVRFSRNESLWLRRHRFSMVENMNYGHAFTGYWEKFGETHPEYFNLLPDGTRRSDPMYFNGRPDLISMCVSNPGLAAQIVEDWKARGAAGIINCNENDTAGKCTCPACLASDENPDGSRLEQARKEFQNKTSHWYGKLGSLSDRYAKFYLAVQQLADQIDPDNRIIGCIYGNYHEPPEKTRLNERIILRFCPPIMFPWTDAKIALFKRLWQGWSDSGASLMFRPNFTWDGHNFPLVYYREFADCFDFARDHGLIASDMDALTSMFAANGLTNYIIAAKHGGGIYKSVEELENDYFSAFGPAAQVIRKYFSNLEKASRYNDFETARNIEGGNYADFFLLADRVFTPEVMTESFKLLDEAAVLAENNRSATARIEFLRMGLQDAQLVITAQRGFRKYKENGNSREFVAAIRNLKQFRDGHEQHGYANLGVTSYLEGRHWPLHLILLNDNSRALDNWTICFDPQNVGQNEQWFMEKRDGWEAIGTDSHWEKQPAGLKWQNIHGKPFKGAAWYRNSFRLEDQEKNKRIKLAFGAVDGSATVWLNGNKVLERPFPYQGDPDSWKKPFELDITDFVKPAEENDLTIRVEKYEGASGIWRPVYLSTFEADFDNPSDDNILTGKWERDVRHGRFTFQSARYPLTIQCTEASSGSPRNGVWGRLYQSVPVINGQSYHFRVRFRTSEDFKGVFEVWLRSASAKGLNPGNINLGSIGTNGQSKTLTGQIRPDTEACTVFLNLVNGTGSLEIENIELYPAASD